MDTPLRLPTLFLSHGSPMLAVEDSSAGRFLDDLGTQLPRPRAIVVASAHFMADRPMLGGHAQPHTVHDFGGFPQPLYQIQYPALGDQGVLVIGSGGFVHNLGDLGWQHKDAPLAPWAAEFGDWMHTMLAARDWSALLDWQQRAPHAQQAHPTVEHLMPLFVALGAAGDSPNVRTLHRSYEFGSLALDAFAFN